MLLRFSLIFALAFVFSINQGLALEEEDKENNPPIQNQSLTPVAKKRKRNIELKNQENQHKYQKTPERHYWSPFKRGMIKEEYPTLDKKKTISSPWVREFYKRIDSGDFFSRHEFEGKTVGQADLFDPHSQVLSQTKVWETNLQRMERGCAPVGDKGIISAEERVLLTYSEIQKKQNLYKIDLQHVTQKDTGTEEDPICEMTHDAHMGIDTRFLLEQDSITQEVRIAYSGLKKEEALRILESNPHLHMVANVLHFRGGGRSLIDRRLFNDWKSAYWKSRASEIKSNRNTKPPIFRPLFSDPISEEEGLILVNQN